MKKCSDRVLPVLAVFVLTASVSHHVWAQAVSSPPVTASQTAVHQPRQALLPLDLALAAAYRNNPELEAARAALRAIDEDYAIAQSGYRPYITGDASYVSGRQEGDITTTSSDPKTVGVGLRQPLYRGGSTAARVKASDNRIKAQRAMLQSVEQNVLYRTAVAYMDVVRAQKVVALNENNRRVFETYLEEARQRFSLGDLTKTDVSQAESRLANAEAELATAQAGYRSARARFERETGIAPDGVDMPRIRVDIPATLDGAIAEARQKHPRTIYARYAAEEARHATRVVRGEGRPQLDLTGGIAHTWDPAQRIDDEVTGTSVGIVATVPFYTGGATDARIRKSRQTEQQRRHDIDTAERAVEEAVIDSWARLEAADREMQARATQIAAAELALEGVRIENDYGARTTLDLLNAEQEFLDAQVAYVTAEREKIVTVYGFLASIGELTAARLHLPVGYYDSTAYFQKVKNRWGGTKIADDPEKPAETPVPAGVND